MFLFIPRSGWHWLQKFITNGGTERGRKERQRSGGGGVARGHWSFRIRVNPQGVVYRRNDLPVIRRNRLIRRRSKFAECLLLAILLSFSGMYGPVLLSIRKTMHPFFPSTSITVTRVSSLSFRLMLMLASIWSPNATVHNIRERVQGAGVDK